MTKRRIEPLENPVPEELFVNRQDELKLFWDWAMSIPKRPANSFALIGRRRTGKTAILKKIYNQLFEKQDRILPVYITFDRYLDRDTPIDSYEFAAEYFGSYIGCYLAFHHRQPALLDLIPNLHDLYQAATRLQDEFALSLFDQYEGALKGRFSSAYILMQSTLNIPRREARWRNIPTAVIIDEFQVLTRVYNPESQRHNDLTDSFQKAAETLWAPLLVSGSAVSVLVEQALGGMLSGRFSYWGLKPLTREYAHDLVFRLAQSTDLPVTEEFAETIWQLTLGHPYSIYSLMSSVCPARQAYPSLDALEEVFQFELSNPLGKLWKHYDKEFRKYSDKLNSGQVTKKVMYWATKYPEQQIDAERVAQEIGVDFEQVQDSLRKLYETDIIDRIGWTLYQGPKDPILRRYIEYNHKREIEKLGPAEIFKDWQKEYKRLRGQANNEKGQFG